MRRLFFTGVLLTIALFLLPAAQLWKGAPSPAAQGTVLRVQTGGQVQTMALEDYVLAVTAAEVPADFPPEALRAQAVAARTYALYKMRLPQTDAHPDADVCDDYRHCAAFRAAPLSGDEFAAIRQAVADTAGEAVLYDGAPIDAVFHCASAERTESAQTVWGEDLPYLQSVVSPGGSALDGYETAVTVTASAFRQAVGQQFPAADVSGPPDSWFSASVRTAAGGIDTVCLGGITVRGGDIRQLFSLPSAHFTVEPEADRITFYCLGSGHQVGMSQYGAKYMAERGKSYREILLHYYPGTEIGTV